MRRSYSTESFKDKAISALLAVIMHAGLLFLLIVGVQWATVDNAPLTAQLWSSGDLLNASDPGYAAESILVDSEPTDSATEPAEPLIETPAETQPEVEQKPLIEPYPASQPAQPNADIKLENDPEKEKKPEQKPQQKPTTPVNTAKPSSDPKPENKPAQQPNQREQALKDRLARERAALASNQGTSSNGSAAGGSGGGSGGMNAGMLARAEQTYREKIRAIILNNTTYPPNFLERLEGNPQAVFVVKLLPDGTIGSVVLRQSSGNATFDRIVSSAIDKTGKLPLPDRPEILPNREVILSFRPRDN